MASPAQPRNAETESGVLQNIAVYKNSPKYSDIIVVVEKSDFHCHRLILAAASDFFQAAFESGMKESHESKMCLENVEKDIFSLLLDFAYGGKYILTKQNLFEIWTVADMLQMPLLLSQCNQLFDDLCSSKVPVKTWMTYLNKVKNFGDEPKMRLIRVVVRNFPAFAKDSNQFTIEEEELKLVLNSDELAVDSEDDAVEFLLKWAARKCSTPSQNLGDAISNQRQTNQVSSPSFNLEGVLECTRYMLLSQMCVYRTLACNSLIQTNFNNQTVVNKFYSYLSQPHLSLTWCPPAAVHREQSPMVNVLLLNKTTINGKLLALDLKTMKWQEMSRPDIHPKNVASKILWYCSKLYVFTNDGKTRVYLAPTNKYHTVDFACTEQILAVGDSLYKFKENHNSTTVFKISSFQEKFQTDLIDWKALAVLPEKNKSTYIKAATNIGKTIILFLKNYGIDNYMIQAYDTTRNLLRTHQPQIGSRSPLVTFHHGDNVFALQENGILWKLELGSNFVDLKFRKELTLWEKDTPLLGAVVYKNNLIAVGDFEEETEVCKTLDISLQGVFENVLLIHHSDLATPESKVTHAVVPKKLLSNS